MEIGLAKIQFKKSVYIWRKFTWDIDNVLMEPKFSVTLVEAMSQKLNALLDMVFFEHEMLKRLMHFHGFQCDIDVGETASQNYEMMRRITCAVYQRKKKSTSSKKVSSYSSSLSSAVKSTTVKDSLEPLALKTAEVVIDLPNVSMVMTEDTTAVKSLDAVVIDSPRLHGSHEDSTDAILRELEFLLKSSDTVVPVLENPVTELPSVDSSALLVCPDDRAVFDFPKELVLKSENPAVIDSLVPDVYDDDPLESPRDDAVIDFYEEPLKSEDSAEFRSTDVFVIVSCPEVQDLDLDIVVLDSFTESRELVKVDQHVPGSSLTDVSCLSFWDWNVLCGIETCVKLIPTLISFFWWKDGIILELKNAFGIYDSMLNALHPRWERWKPPCVF